jgi:hypothetical protein
LKLIHVPLELAMDSLPASLPAVLKTGVSAPVDNEKQKPIDGNARGSTKVLKESGGRSRGLKYFL